MESNEEKARVEASPRIPSALRRRLNNLKLRRRFSELPVYEGFVQRGQTENEEGKLGDDESLSLAAIWVVELFLPSSIEALRRGIDSLGWRRGHRQDDDVDEWIT